MQRLKALVQKLLGKGDGQRGFTLIEVVIVLAIAGLIFVIVFLAVQGAQRSRRDNERRAAASRLIAASEQYSSNNNGGIATNCAALTNYYNNQGGVYTCTDAGTSPSSSNTDRVEFGPNQECSGTNTFSSKTRVAAVRFWSEGANAVQCIDSD